MTVNISRFAGLLVMLVLVTLFSMTGVSANGCASTVQAEQVCTDAPGGKTNIFSTPEGGEIVFVHQAPSGSKVVVYFTDGDKPYLAILSNQVNGFHIIELEAPVEFLYWSETTDAILLFQRETGQLLTVRTTDGSYYLDPWLTLKEGEAIISHLLSPDTLRLGVIISGQTGPDYLLIYNVDRGGFTTHQALYNTRFIGISGWVNGEFSVDIETTLLIGQGD